ncbi:MAG: nucleotidyltransferase family protein [Actinomycetota bacterium]
MVLKDIKEQVKKEFKAEIIGVFGSSSRGEQKKSSDIDILVEFSEGATLFDLVGLGYFLEEKLNRKVDVVSRRAIRAELKDNILREVVNI